jgi:hypothetical protein
MPTIERLPASRRYELAPLLDPASARDVFDRFYALEYPADQLEIFTLRTDPHRISAFLLVARTGIDLFRPLIIPVTRLPDQLEPLLYGALSIKRSYFVHAGLKEKPELETIAHLHDCEVATIYELNSSRFSHQINVLVVKSTSHLGWPVYELRSSSQGYAIAGVNWMDSRGNAEIYVETDQAGRARGFTRSVMSALANELLGSGNRVFYRVPEDNLAMQVEAVETGFTSTNEVTFMGELTLFEGEGSGGRN